MKYKARIIEVGSDGHHQRVTLNVTNIEDLRAIGRRLYEDAIIQTATTIDNVLSEEPLDRLDELLGRLLLPGGKAEHVSASELHELVDEVNALRARKKIGGSDVCETCDAHAQVVEEGRATVATVAGIIELHQKSRLAEGYGRATSLDGAVKRLRSLV